MLYDSKIEIVKLADWQSDWERILMRALKSLNNLHFDWSLSCKTFDLKSTEELSFMPLKCHAKFEKKLTCGLENDLSNLAIFHQSTRECQNWYFDGILLSKMENAWAKKSQRSYVTLKDYKKFEEEVTVPFKIDIRSLTKIDSSTRKSQKFAL